MKVSARWFETRKIKSLQIAGSRRVTIVLGVAPLAGCCVDTYEPAKSYNPGKFGDRPEGRVVDQCGAFTSNGVSAMC
jgi:hypothetical protein